MAETVTHTRPDVPPVGSRRAAFARVAFGAAVAASLGVGGGVASASWAGGGSGDGSATAASLDPPTTAAVPGSAVTTGELYPGATGDAVVTVVNPNPVPMTVTSVAGSGQPTASGGTGTCDVTGVTLTPSDPGLPVAAGGSATLTLPGAAVMSTESETGCQNAVFTIPVTLTVSS
ncbi:hypothetical protein [Pseudonocardia endophytica]|uniref:Uncharacterized protein n=1 Tax=Pseudonocardia endophytica TaxID=401976 RepID=A0A4R1HU16_PSEEN|nr:hypothetical protein [Pseudonocardia endophytica]TCK20922.1 hypothetical protein EV378_4888 [Pseudonocardia endophytica]